MPESYPDLKEIERRPQRYWNADGLPELSMGALWIFWGTALSLPHLLPTGTWLAWYTKALPVVLVVGGMASHWITKKLKERITFPRGGYITWPKPSLAMRLIPAIIAALVGAALVFLVVKGRAEAFRNLTAPACGVLIALALLVPSLRWRLPHFLILSAAALVLAFIIFTRHMDAWQGVIFLLLTLGPIATLIGAVRLRSYLRGHSAPAEGNS